MILAALTLALTAQPTLLIWTNEAGREVSIRYRSQAACERARPAVQRRMELHYRRLARQRGSRETRWAVDPSCIGAPPRRAAGRTGR